MIALRTRTVRARIHLVVAALVSVPVLAGCGQGAEGAPAPAPPSTSTAGRPAAVDVSAELDGLEEEFDARLGVSAHDTADGRVVEHRADERFGFTSTMKAFAAAELLRQVPAEERDARVTWTRDTVEQAGYAPVTGEHVDDGLTLAELAEAAVRDSDNAAMNLVLDRIGGPAGLTAGLARLGDTTTEVVSTEPALNTIDPASTDDTSTAAALTADLTALLSTENLDADDRRLLVEWMSGNATGDPLVRAGAPEGWVVADKSGGAGPIRNDLALVTPPDRAPIVITVLSEKDDPAAEYDDELVARAAEVVLTALD